MLHLVDIWKSSPAVLLSPYLQLRLWLSSWCKLWLLLGLLPYLLPLSGGLCLLNGRNTHCKRVRCMSCLIVANAGCLGQFYCSILTKCTNSGDWWHLARGLALLQQAWALFLLAGCHGKSQGNRSRISRWLVVGKLLHHTWAAFPNMVSKWPQKLWYRLASEMALSQLTILSFPWELCVEEVQHMDGLPKLLYNLWAEENFGGVVVIWLVGLFFQGAV